MDEITFSVTQGAVYAAAFGAAFDRELHEMSRRTGTAVADLASLPEATAQAGSAAANVARAAVGAMRRVIAPAAQKP